MTAWQDDVRTFMQEVKGLDLPTSPTAPSWKVARLVLQLLHEEMTEAIQAIFHLFRASDLLEPQAQANATSLAEVAKELADSIYVLLYAANALGIDLEPVWQEVQRTNMLKKGGPTRLDGKAMKPPDWQPPDIASIIAAQMQDHKVLPFRKET